MASKKEEKAKKSGEPDLALRQLIDEIQKRSKREVTQKDIAERSGSTSVYFSKILGWEKDGIPAPSKLLKRIRNAFELELEGTWTISRNQEDLLKELKEQTIGQRAWIDVLADTIIPLMQERNPGLSRAAARKELEEKQKVVADRRLREA